jgi:chitinase
LLTPDAHELGAIATSGGWANYPDICSITNDQVNGHVVWDEEARVPYCYRGSDWISYDDERSIREKMALIAEFGLGGAMVFSLDTDDFAGVCDGKGESKFPLLNVVVENLH